ncbi:hypothetical protein DY120_07305 [Apilactobacillus micheneri]|uniref:Uncharacterized protein n=1 Tax=Apilactobacillus micheneri TaxID=1899430 RepID=A0ABY2YZM6_9LACO|nr:hypothetical protein [Apilactobacillus micheneri]TPR23105.1 hypothetical protein DY114_07290 [Apilactobacillus micheneri]TPR24423.1 hypothetical protein DY111_07305 [Apilactobacillus micheneri]TPR29370.1 hypothetical protein DY120_07305 [Apilactobacillus micheneri]TPR34577.1 hypothetical protein DY027_07295 [Apilactobacillus micheneri]
MKSQYKRAMHKLFLTFCEIGKRTRKNNRKIKNPYNIHVDSKDLKKLKPHYYQTMYAHSLYDWNTIKSYENIAIEFSIVIMEAIERKYYKYGKVNLYGNNAYIIYRLINNEYLPIAYIYFSEFTPVNYLVRATYNERQIIDEQVKKYFKFAKSRGGYFI